MFVVPLSSGHRGLRRYRSLLLLLFLLLRRVAYFGFRVLRRDRRNAKPRYEDPVLIWFEGLKYYNENIYYNKKKLV